MSRLQVAQIVAVGGCFVGTGINIQQAEYGEAIIAFALAALNFACLLTGWRA